MNALFWVLLRGIVGILCRIIKKGRRKVYSSVNPIKWWYLMYIAPLIGRWKWLRNGRPMVKYEGFTCGCCGRGWKIPFEIPEYKSMGEWYDTWGLCPKGKGCWNE